MASHLQNDVERIDKYRACLHAGVAGSARMDFFRCNPVEQGFAIVVAFAGLFALFNGESDFLGAVAHIHHDFSGRQFFARLVGRAGGGATATFGT